MEHVEIVRNFNFIHGFFLPQIHELRAKLTTTEQTLEQLNKSGSSKNVILEATEKKLEEENDEKTSSNELLKLCMCLVLVGIERGKELPIRRERQIDGWIEKKKENSSS